MPMAMAPTCRQVGRSWRIATAKPSSPSGVSAEEMTAPSPLLISRSP